MFREPGSEAIPGISHYFEPMEGTLRAGFGRRFVALTLDWLMSSALLGFFPRLTFEQTQGARLVVFFLEISLFTILVNGSAGQLICRLRVLDVQTGSRLSTQKVLLRTLLICLVLPAVFRSEGRGYHEILTGSEVVKI